ncbi:MAG: hypothetical protein ACRD0H_13695, partial [Actinomycetes bacterium]
PARPDPPGTAPATPLPTTATTPPPTTPASSGYPETPGACPSTRAALSSSASGYVLHTVPGCDLGQFVVLSLLAAPTTSTDAREGQS